MFLSVLLLLFAAWLVTRYYGAASRVESALAGFVGAAAFVVLVAYVLSGWRHLGSVAGWNACSAGVLVLVLLPALANRALRQRCLRMPLPRDLLRRLRSRVAWRSGTLYLALPALSVVVVAAVNLCFILRLQPATLDVLKYHLARVGYFLQHGSLAYYAPNHWAQIVHPKVSAILMIYTYLVTGRESLTSLVQFVAYWVCMLAVFGIARESGATRRAACLAALVFGLLTICITEASSAQNDLLLAAFAGCFVYALLRYRAQARARTLLLATLAFALGISVKLSFVTLLPSCALAVGWNWRARPALPPALRRRHLAIAVASLAAAACLIILPAGYWDNMRHFGHPAGPWQVRVLHTFERRPPAQVAGLGTKNILRYADDFVQLDGLGPVPGAFTLQQGITALPRRLLAACRIDLTAGAELRGTFHFVRNLYASENTSSWGVLGFLLLWPAVWWVAFRSPAPAWRGLALGALAFVLVQAYTGPYDAWRGRYFLAGALFAAPCVAALPFPPRRRAARAYLCGVTAIGCCSALCSAAFRQDTFLFGRAADADPFRNAFAAEQTPQLTRIKQLVRQVPALANPLARYEAQVPANAVVAIDVSKPLPEALFFGAQFSRRLLPLFPFGANDLPRPMSFTNSPHLPLPAAADYLLCTPDSPYHTPGDAILLDNDAMFGTVYLRRLH